MRSSLRELFGRLAPIQDAGHARSGSPVTLHLALRGPDVVPKTVTAALSLARAGASLLSAKRAMDTLVEQHAATIDLPAAQSLSNLLAELHQSGITGMIEPSEPAIPEAFAAQA